MATIEYKVCDRCKETINKHSRRIDIIKKKTKTLRYFLNYGSGVRTEWTIDLCGECTKKLELFLHGEEFVRQVYGSGVTEE